MAETVAVKVDESRAMFEEAWIADNSKTPEEAEKVRNALKRIWISDDSNGGAYFDSFVMLAWTWWQKSRAALVVDIASHTEFEIEHMISPEKEGYSIGWIDGRNYSVEQVRAAGITVKGDSDAGIHSARIE